MPLEQQATVVRVRTKPPDVKISDFKTICRICLEKKPSLQSIFNTKMKISDGDICSKLKSVSKIKVQLNDELPQNICNKCINFLLTACFFKSLCEQSDAKLRNILHKSQIVKNTALPEDVRDVLKIEHNSKQLNSKTNKSETDFKREDNGVMSKINYLKSEPDVCSSELVKLVKLEDENDQQEGAISSDMEDIQCTEEKSPEIPTVPLESEVNVAKKGNNNAATCGKRNVAIRRTVAVGKKKKVAAKDFLKQNIIDMYRDKMHRLKLQKTLGSKYNCKKCKTNFPNRISYDAHMSKHVALKKPKSKLQCDHCEYTTYGRNVLTNHLSKEHNIRSSTFMCEECGTHFVSQSGLQLHMQKHRPTRRTYKCSHCSYASIAKSSLIRHQRTHTRDYQYTCEECGKSFITSGALSVHKKRHTGVRDQQCTLCEKNYVRRSELLSHIEVVHKNIRPYVCSVVEGCSKAFYQRSKLKIHIRDVHKITTEIDIPSVKKKRTIEQ